MTETEQLKLVQKGAKKENNLRRNLAGKTSRPALVHEDFCDEKLCRFFGENKPRRHVACLKNKAPSLCPLNVTSVDFNLSEQSVILTLHNKVRNYVASGSNILYHPANRMAFMDWDYTLAFVASFNAKSCDFRHDDCRNTRKFKYSGQNLGIRETSQRAKDRNEMMSHFVALINAWIAEGNRYCNQTFIDSFRPHPNPSFQIGRHFTEMVRDENSFVGCSAVEYSFRKNWFYLIACNYATNNFYKERIYASGAPCSACRTGCHAKYKCLCSENEVYRLN